MSQIEVTMIGIISSNAVGKLKAFMAFKKNNLYTLSERCPTFDVFSDF